MKRINVLKTSINKKGKKQRQDGITLIALVITIIILLILAGIGIAMLTGESGLLNKASKSKEETLKSEALEDVKLKVMEAQAENEGKATLADLLEILEKAEDTYKITLKTETAKVSNEKDVANIENANALIVTNEKYGQEVEVDKNMQVKLTGVSEGPTEETNFGSGNGTENDPYIIENMTQLKFLATSVNEGLDTYEGKYIKLSNDITLDSNIPWTPIGSDTNMFEGVFDGNNKSISGLYMNSNQNYQGFIGINKGIIKNINISSDCIASSIGWRSGILCGENRGTIENCTSRGTLDYTINTGKHWQGAICGFNNGGIIKNCANYGNITGYGNVGGIAGGCGNDGIILNCLNLGNIRAEYTYDSGGICGNSSEQGKGKAYFFNCYNAGDISCVNYNVGGIIGMSTNETYLYNCYNIGNISSSRKCGIAYWESAKPNLTNCYCLNSISQNSYSDDKANRINEDSLKKSIEILNNGIDEIGATQSTESPWIEDQSNINRGFPILKFQM